MRTELDAAAEAHGSSEFKSIGSFESGRDVGSIRAAMVAVNGAMWQRGNGRRRRHHGHARAKVAGFAVGVVNARAGAAVRTNIVVGVRRYRALMLMFVVTEVLLGSNLSFMRTHRCSSRPDQLEGKHEQHESDDGPATHWRAFYWMNYEPANYSAISGRRVGG